jgi:hypothetical protein
MARIVVVGCLLALAAPLASNEQLQLKVSPEVSAEPAWIVVRASIEPDDANRAIRVVAESEGFFRSSLVQLDGKDASRTAVLQYKSLPAGEYEIRGVLIGRDGRERAIARQFVMVTE